MTALGSFSLVRWHEDFVNELRSMKVTPHVAQNTSGRSPARPGSEMMAIANVGLDDPPAAVELSVRRRAHADAANSFGSRVRL
jgi:hypothetical protein